MSAWKPGDVAMVTHDGEDLVAVRGHSLWADRWFIGGPSRGSQHGWTDASLDAVRPLVVIDPEDREQAKRLMSIFHALGEHKGTTFVDRWQDALREFAKPTPPPIEEPTGLGAVVRDTEGGIWMRWFTHGRGCNDWFPRSVTPDGDPDGNRRRIFNAIGAAEVLSEGAPS